MAHVRLAIDGEISIPRTFSFEELRAIPDRITERAALFGRRDFVGVRLGALVASLGVKSWARFVVVRGGDGYVANIPIDVIDDCVLVFAIGERPLWSDLGGPLRLFAGGQGRCGNVKNVVGISFAVEAARVEHPCRHEHARTQAKVAGGG
jgi:DMSO/TMAO reductase YedYZ molybdopterin-dependent catalytic subunit